MASGGAFGFLPDGVVLGRAVFQAERRACPKRKPKDLPLNRLASYASLHHYPIFLVCFVAPVLTFILLFSALSICVSASSIAFDRVIATKP
jgi:hypothetical protein